MKTGIIFLLGLLLGTALLAQQKLIPVAAESSVHFVIRNFGINTGGDLSQLKGIIYFDKNNLAQSSFDITVDVATLDTDNSRRDKHLLSVDYFDAAKYPTIRIAGKPVLDNNGGYTARGTLTIKNTTRPISFLFTVKAQPGGYLFEAKFTINRLIYQVGKQSAVLSDDVKVSLKVLAK